MARINFLSLRFSRLPQLSASIISLALIWVFVALANCSPAMAQTLEEQLRQTSLAELVRIAKEQGDPARGAIVFFQQHMACAKCHQVGKATGVSLGPNLAALGSDVTDEQLVESVLNPSKVIRKGYESVTIVNVEGRAITALLVERTPEKVVVKELDRAGESTDIPTDQIETLKINTESLMPAGQVNQLASRQQFLDLVRYLMEIRTGGELRAAQLQPAASLIAFTVPEYEQHIDHKGLIGDWNDDAFKRGEAIYQRVCANCHGTHDKPGSLPTSLRFAEGKFKNGSDPLSMYRTLTRGFGLMAPQAWMVPSQKYDVIHYIREAYLKSNNPSQWKAVDASYLAQLPPGDTRGPEPSNIVPWSAMDYGPSLTHTYEIPGLEHNLAYKGVAVRLDSGAGGVSRGRHWMIFDTDTMRAAAGWNGSGDPQDSFIDWQGIQFNGAHGVHPRLVGKVAFANATGPGWGDPGNGQFQDEKRVLGRDGRRYGPLHHSWAKFRGQYLHGQDVVFSYTVGNAEVLESPRLVVRDGKEEAPLFLRTFNIGPRDRDLILQVAEHPVQEAQLRWPTEKDPSWVTLAPPFVPTDANQEFTFDGNSYLEVTNAKQFDLIGQDFSIVAKIKTKSDGTLWSLAPAGPKWAPDGQTFFIRDGRLGLDIGWVGAVTAKTKINDNQWHQVAVTWQKKDRKVRFYVDGKLDGEGTLAAKAPLQDRVVRIGFTSPDFPRPHSFFHGEMEEVRFYQRSLDNGLVELSKLDPADKTLLGSWKPRGASGDSAKDASAFSHDALVRHGLAPVTSMQGPVVAGFSPRKIPATWLVEKGKLRLKILAGKEPLRFSVWLPANASTILPAEIATFEKSLQNLVVPMPDRDLSSLTQGGPPRWPEKLVTSVTVGDDKGPFAVDILSAPESNPWLAQTRFTGLDFFSDGRMAVCTWDGDVWVVESQANTSSDSDQAAKPTLRWQRIASGMFQPLGLRIVKDKIHVTCRDQLTVLHDLNDDGEIDFYQCLNNDHQVTEHFHEFAMGLQTDAEGNFYYAKSAEHGKAAVVPHHGTLLRVSRDGQQTEILANGFRAANGVCLNPDGSFVVTDQEGFWNPKNRINWVTLSPSGKPKFYGNMLGYHDVTDSSDAAMEPPLCWITNAFDRSPAELLWVDSDKWGPLKGSLLNLSYGYGKVFLVPHENVGGVMQGGMIELPIPSFPTGVMRGRFQPKDGQLYLCGMFAWAGNATQPGGLYRLRATGHSVHLPKGLHATKAGLKLEFTNAIDPRSIDPKLFSVKSWSLKRSAKYGSEHYDEKSLEIKSVRLSDDGKLLQIDLPGIEPTWCMEIKYALLAKDGTPINGTIHNTIHALAD